VRGSVRVLRRPVLTTSAACIVIRREFLCRRCRRRQHALSASALRLSPSRVVSRGVDTGEGGGS